MQFIYEWYDDLAVRMGLELVWGLQAGPELDVVVDLSIDGEDDLSIVTDERLCTGVCNAQSSKHVF